MYLCEVAIVSQLCIFSPYILHGLCEDYLTCDIAFNAVMPLSRASTRGRYSRIEGVTKGVLQVSPKVDVGLAYFEIRICHSDCRRGISGPLGNAHHISLASIATTELVAR